MTSVMNRGKQQVLLKYLPGKTFDFERIGTIAQVERIRGAPKPDLNLSLVLHAVADELGGWTEGNRPSFRDPTRDASRFILLDPLEVQARMFPLTLWCQNASCGIVREIRDDTPLTARCSFCKSGRLIQSRFVRIHRCGALLEISPPKCERCASISHMALDTRGSQKLLDFRWICRNCGTPASFFAGRCPACHWVSENPADRNMNVEVHRAGRTYFPHNLVLLNQPGEGFARFLELKSWQAIAAARYLAMPELVVGSLMEYISKTSPIGSGFAPILTSDERTRLRMSGKTERQIQEFEEMQADLRGIRAQAATNESPERIASMVVERTGVPGPVWEDSGKDSLEALLPSQTGSTRDSGPIARESQQGALSASDLRDELGIGSMELVTDFPVTNVTFGYSRVSNKPNECRINSFPADADHAGKFPIFVDTVQADALVIHLNPNKVLDWLKANGCEATPPNGSDRNLAAQAYFFKLLSNRNVREPLDASNPEARLTFSLMHTMSHLALRRAAWLCGLDATSLSEYVLPRTLRFAIYCNHRFGATIGALVALYEQSLSDWLKLLASSHKCVYDPLCLSQGGVCHSCLHLAENSCRFFNANLSRSHLFGGWDSVLKTTVIGFIPFLLTARETSV
jgi:hypothetical protein